MQIRVASVVNWRTRKIHSRINPFGRQLYRKKSGENLDSYADEFFSPAHSAALMARSRENQSWVSSNEEMGKEEGRAFLYLGRTLASPIVLSPLFCLERERKGRENINMR